ncbi:MAG: hypothetical protein JSS14_16060 [Proteobacteria bacterium]|nr:hypothetical protein [Pseudomonadota bacterium]
MKVLARARAGLWSVLVVLVSLLALAPAPAQATTLINCTGQTEILYSPGLTNQAQAVTYTGEDRATLCISLTHPTLQNFVGPFSGGGQLSCTSLTNVSQGTETLYWNGTTTLTSSWTFTYNPVMVGGSLISTVSGPITAGVAAGATLTQVLVLPLTALAACSEPGGLPTQKPTSTWAFSG